MKASVEGRVRHTNLPKTKPLLPLFEATVNAFQAIDEARGADIESTFGPNASKVFYQKTSIARF